jgi:hypothetical protein
MSTFRHKNILSIVSRCVKLCTNAFDIRVDVYLKYLSPRAHATSSRVQNVNNSD